ncbi:hypothetical protein EfmJHP36_32550 (plasmid) [Enterococcus faecium]|nr:hypothetical protein EfmJHP36_32550 [Enterococcus faecium]
MRSSKYTELESDTFITFKEIMRTVSNIYHNCVPDKIKNRRNTDQLKQRDTVIIAWLETLSEEANLPNILGGVSIISRRN